MSEQSLPCLLLPLGDTYWLIPSAVGAEIVPQALERQSQKEKVLSYDWREQKIPLINREWLLNKFGSEKVNSRVCVLNSLNAQSKNPFWGIELSGVPTFVHLNPEDLTVISETLPDYMQAKVQLKDKKSAYIPKLEELEALL